MHRKLGFLFVAVAASSLVFSATAVADPIGDTYQFFGSNLGVPDQDFGLPTFTPGFTGAVLTFDGIAEPIPAFSKLLGSPQAMLINESAIAFPGNPAFLGFGTGLEFPGTGIEISLSHAVPFGGFNQFTDNAGPITIAELDIDFSPAGPALFASASAFLWFTIDGVTLPYSVDPALVDPATVVPHPWDPGVPNVLLLGTDGIFPLGQPLIPLVFPPGTPSDGLDAIVSTSVLGDISWEVLLTALGLAGSLGSINGVHLGMVVNEVPEPSTYALMAIGAMALIPVIRRRKRR